MRAARKSAAALAAFAAAPAAGVEPLPLGIDRLPIGRIFPSPLNPRKRIAEDGLAELETSIARNGILQPITVRPAAEADRAKGDWEIVMGARRWTAASRAVASGKMPADYAAPVIVRPCSDEELVTLAATENMARKDMHPLEEAEVLEALRQTMRPELGPRDTKEAAAGRVVGMPERTVFRRLALLRLAPELRERLLADEITLGQAYAFIPAPPKVQLETFRELTKGRKTGLAGIADDTIGRALLGHAFCLDAARFALKALKGDVVQAFGRKWTFAVAEARKLQGDWIDARLAELAKMRPWVERVDSSIWQRGYRDAPRGAKDKRAGFVLQVHPETCEVFELDYVLRAADVAADEAKRRGDKASGAAGAGERPRKAMTEPQLVAAKWAKSEAIRLAVTEDPRAGLAVAILGLLGAVEVRIGTPTSGHPHVSNPKKPVPAREALIAKALAPIATVLKRGKVEVGFFGGEAGTQAAVLRRLLELDLEDLVRLLAALAADRVGAWFHYQNQGAIDTGDTAFAIELAGALGASARLPAIWQPDEDYFRGMSRDRLVALVGAVDGFEGAANAKKAELVKWCAAQKPGFWRPDLFPELRFADHDAIAGAILGRGAP